MSYSELTDFDINKLVAEKEFLTKGGGFSEFDEKDYCNNPSDVWPIILENGINIKHLPSSDAWEAWDSKDICVCSIHESPLRAVMIVYLMMGDEL